jgi:hypothetical protein
MESVEKEKTSPLINIPDRRRLFEVLAVALTGLGKFIFMDAMQWRFTYIAFACLAWLTYVIYRQRQQAAIWTYWGFTLDGFGSTFLRLLPPALLVAVSCWLLGNYWGSNRLNWGIIPIMLLYPIWGIIQQFLIVGLIGRNLKDLKSYQLSTTAVVAITATVFAIVHYPSYLLIGGTFMLAIVYTLLYLRGSNLLVLGIYHGWLGGFFFYTLLNRDPWQEVFGNLSPGLF